MASARQIKKLEALLAQSLQFHNFKEVTPDFTAWRDEVERTLQKVYGVHSIELKQFHEVKFNYNPGVWMLGEDYSTEIKEAFHMGLKIVKRKLEVLIGELLEEAEDAEVPLFGNSVTYGAQIEVIKTAKAVSRVFVSHAHKDGEYVEELIEFLRLIGLTKKQIFCTSIQGYGVPLGANFLEEIKERVADDVLVLFVLSPNFYASPVCLAEMGAAWVLTKAHVPLVIPPFTFRDIQGVLPHTQGLMINNDLATNELAEKIQGIFDLKNYTEIEDYERLRNRIIKRIDDTIEKDAAAVASAALKANPRATARTFKRHEAI